MEYVNVWHQVGDVTTAVCTLPTPFSLFFLLHYSVLCRLNISLLELHSDHAVPSNQVSGGREGSPNLVLLTPNNDLHKLTERRCSLRTRPMAQVPTLHLVDCNIKLAQ